MGRTPSISAVPQGSPPGETFRSRCSWILALQLPGLTGLQGLQRMQGEAQTRSLPVILVSAVDAPDDLAPCHALGYALCLTKPVLVAPLLGTIQQLGLERFAYQCTGSCQSDSVGA